MNSTHYNKLSTSVENKSLSYIKIDPMLKQKSKNIFALPLKTKNICCGICQGPLDNKSQAKTFLCSHKVHLVKK